MSSCTREYAKIGYLPRPTTFKFWRPPEEALFIHQPGELCPLAVGPPDLEVDEEVEGGERDEGDDVHEDEVESVDVDADVDLVVAQPGGHGERRVLAVDDVRDPRDLPEPGQVVQRGEGDDGGHVGAGAPVRADGARPQRQAHGHVPLHGDAEGLAGDGGISLAPPSSHPKTS